MKVCELILQRAANHSVFLNFNECANFSVIAYGAAIAIPQIVREKSLPFGPNIRPWQSALERLFQMEDLSMESSSSTCED